MSGTWPITTQDLAREIADGADVIGPYLTPPGASSISYTIENDGGNSVDVTPQWYGRGGGIPVIGATFTIASGDSAYYGRDNSDVPNRLGFITACTGGTTVNVTITANGG